MKCKSWFLPALERLTGVVESRAAEISVDICGALGVGTDQLCGTNFGDRAYTFRQVMVSV